MVIQVMSHGLRVNMRKMAGFFFVLVIFLTMGCEGLPQATEYRFGDYRVYYQSHGPCEMFVMQLIGEDDDHLYYLTSSGCSAGDYYFVRRDWDYVSVKDAMDEGWITIADITESQAPFVYVEIKEATP